MTVMMVFTTMMVTVILTVIKDDLRLNDRRDVPCAVSARNILSLKMKTLLAL